MTPGLESMVEPMSDLEKERRDFKDLGGTRFEVLLGVFNGPMFTSNKIFVADKELIISKMESLIGNPFGELNSPRVDTSNGDIDSWFNRLRFIRPDNNTGILNGYRIEEFEGVEGKTGYKVFGDVILNSDTYDHVISGNGWFGVRVIHHPIHPNGFADVAEICAFDFQIN